MIADPTVPVTVRVSSTVIVNRTVIVIREVNREVIREHIL